MGFFDDEYERQYLQMQQNELLTRAYRDQINGLRNSYGLHGGLSNMHPQNDPGHSHSPAHETKKEIPDEVLLLLEV